ncbi:hypothetical protein PsYK624_165710 [Phanerochaete sordida]|uniref:DUF6699 domain-containing protein n=1 Tax=Phanerochaete sordida TaxID=48140 RepID=A0A9P3LM79_9APHY|nr:hypothetical protein PsYK624_165710 [Phanerochaete sordida]
MYAHVPLLRVPNELLLHIKDSIDHTDLLSHVCYYQLHPRTQACYASDDARGRFWETLLYENGLGFAFFGPRITARTDLRQAAIEHAKHAWECKHLACGQARLQLNKRQLDIARQALKPAEWSGATGSIFSADRDSFVPCICDNNIFDSINFNHAFPPEERDWERRSKLVGDCAFLQAGGDGWRTSDLVRHHPIALASFATFPPINRCRILHDFLPEDGDTYVEVENGQGVTVNDFLTALAAILNELVSTDAVGDLIRHSDYWDLLRPFPPTWTHEEATLAVHRAGHWFQVNLWEGVLFDGCDSDGMFCDLCFRKKPLPPDVFSHIKQYMYPKAE